jgi:hypothetical protein
VGKGAVAGGAAVPPPVAVPGKVGGRKPAGTGRGKAKEDAGAAGAAATGKAGKEVIV